MRVSTAFLVAVVVVSGALGVYGWTLAEPGRTKAQAPPRSGMSVLKAFRCFKPETKVVLTRGVEDRFDPKGTEPVFLRPERRSAYMAAAIRGGSYDQIEEDRYFTDSILAPERISRAVFVIGLKKIRGSENDSISIGDSSGVQGAHRGLRMATSQMTEARGWRSSGNVHFARFEDIMFTPPRPGQASGGPRTLQDYVQQGGQRWIDVDVSDDTSVDFIGMAACVGPPPTGKGVTFVRAVQPAIEATGITILACNPLRDDRPACDPYVGDTPCETSLPVACIRPDEAPLPATMRERMAISAWSGGRIAVAPATPASRFRALADVDRYCQRHLGKAFRTLSYQDGARANAVSGYGRANDFEPRVWIDIADQAHATCWARR